MNIRSKEVHEAPRSHVLDSTLELWRRISAHPAHQVDAALVDLMQWIADTIDADSVVWIGAVKIQSAGQGPA